MWNVQKSTQRNETLNYLFCTQNGNNYPDWDLK